MSEDVHSWIEDVRRRLASPPPQRLPLSEARQAAVLVPLHVESGQLQVLLTKRSDELPHHRSQIAFPGGGREIGEDPWTTALRETEEELALDSRRILRLGQLDEAWTPSGYRIIPCVGAVPAPVEVVPNEQEIAEAFSLPLAEFAEPEKIEDRRVEIDGRERRLRIYHVEGRQVWGLTARVLQNLMIRLGLDSGPDHEDP
ncbi:MAG: CoA pyrophosphatase [Thermoanaerobaculia bacterium]|nr:CoA pyrophosphatase [Thermoanaerobaculia bacterium]